MRIKHNKKTIDIDNIIEANSWLKFRGLMFRSKKKAPILLFNTNKPMGIHSYFVFFSFLTLWLDKYNSVVDWKVVKPFKFYEKSDKPFSKILEIPLDEKYHSIVSFIDGETFKKK